MTDGSDDLSRRLEGCYTAVVHDVMRAMGLRGFTLPHEIRPILPERRLAGPISTLRGRPDPSADPHRSLLEWTGFLSEARPGHVVVCQPNDLSIALMGELSAEALQLKGVRGYVVDGGCRDVDFILKLGFQVCCRYFTPRDVVGAWLPDGQDVPIEIGGVLVRPGDYLCGDRAGVSRRHPQGHGPP
jgi:regulator of RNase E activity RraA